MPRMSKANTAKPWRANSALKANRPAAGSVRFCRLPCTMMMVRFAVRRPLGRCPGMNQPLIRRWSARLGNVMSW